MTALLRALRRPRTSSERRRRMMPRQKRFFRALLDAGIRGSEMARRAGLSRAQISRMRHGRSPLADAVRRAVRSIQEDVARVRPPKG